MLSPQAVAGARVLDLYAGSGALGIEALSRGAASCDFVERDARNATLIQENLDLAGVAERGRVVRADVARAEARLEGAYRLVLGDPPYDDEAAIDAIERVAASPAVASDATLVLELSSRRQTPARCGPLALRWQRRYGDTQIAIYDRTEARL